MILVSELREYVASKKEQLVDVNLAKVVVKPAELVNFLSDVKNSDNQIMIAVMPDARTTGEEDNLRTVNALGFYFLEKTDYTVDRQEKWLDVFERTQKTALEFFYKLLDEMKNGDCNFMRYLEVRNIGIEPESDLAGCNGWTVEIFFNIPV